YEVSTTEVKEVLGFPVSGHQSFFGSGVGRSFGASVLGYETLNGIRAIKVKFSVSYNVGEQPKDHLFSKDQVACFTWDARQNKFVLDESKSQLSKREIKKVYNIDSLTDEQFVKHNPTELLRVAERGSEKQKEWLKVFLKKLNNSPQKAKLMQALKR